MRQCREVRFEIISVSQSAHSHLRDRFVSNFNSIYAARQRYHTATLAARATADGSEGVTTLYWYPDNCPDTNTERPHQGIGNIKIGPWMPGTGDIVCDTQLDGLLKSFRRAA